MLLLIAGIALALAISSLLATAELAIFALTPPRIRTLEDREFRGAGALARLRERPQRPLILLRLLRVLADALAVALAVWLALRLWPAWTAPIAAAVVALLVLYVTQLVPLRLVAGRQVEIALRWAPPVAWLARPLAPLLALFEGASRAVPLRGNGASFGVTENEVRQIVALGEGEGLIDEHERALIDRVFLMSETRVWDIMTPRVDVFAWADSSTLREIATRLPSVPYSRIPVYGEGIDDITGVLYIRDAYQALVSGQRDVRLRELARQPLMVPGSVPLARLLREFQNRRIHVAIVLDEYGGTEGLVTLEDVIEELVGEIVDETDVPDEPILRLSRTEVVAAGDAELREINHYFNITLPQLEHRSLNGYLLEELGTVPETGEKLDRDGLEIEVLEATETQVVRARLRRTTTPGELERQRGRASEEQDAAAASTVDEQGSAAIAGGAEALESSTGETDPDETSDEAWQRKRDAG